MVTVLMTTYNGEKYLREQLDSILNQADCPLRLVVSDDGSTDGTMAILKEYAGRYPEKVEILRENADDIPGRSGMPKEAAGSGAPQTTAVTAKTHYGSSAKHFFAVIDAVRKDSRYSDSAYFALSDQDDVWKPEKLKLAIAAIESCADHPTNHPVDHPTGSSTGTSTDHPTDIPVLVHSDLSLADSEGRLTAESMAAQNRMRMDHTALNYRLVENAVSGNTVVMNRAFLNQLAIPEACIMHDWWMALAGACIGKIIYLPEPTVLYRQHSANVYGSHKHFTAAEIRENYHNMFRQAEQLLAAYGDRMDDKNKELLTAFIRMQTQSRVGKIATILKYRFFKSRPIMTLGMMLKIS